MKTRNWTHYLDVTGNVLVAGTCLYVCTLLTIQEIERWRGGSTSAAVLPDVVPVGTTLDPPVAVSYAKADFTLLVGLSTTCRYCDESLPAFRRLNERVRTRDGDRVQVVALAGQPTQILAEYLSKNDLSLFMPILVERSSHLAPIVQRTPSVVLVDRKGRVVATWPGLITDRRLDEVFRHLDAVPRPR